MIEDRLYVLAVVILALGLRQAEALNLRWSDIDLDAGNHDGEWHEDQRQCSNRSLPPVRGRRSAPASLAELEDRMAAPVWGDPDLVFTTTVGTVIDGRNVLRWWHDLTERGPVSAAGASTPAATPRPRSCLTTGCPSRSFRPRSAMPAWPSPPMCTPRSAGTPAHRGDGHGSRARRGRGLASWRLGKAWLGRARRGPGGPGAGRGWARHGAAGLGEAR